MTSAAPVTRVAFIMEQHLGHRTYYQNLRAAITNDPRIRAEWIEVTYREGGLPWERLAIMPGGIKAALTAAWQVRRHLTRRRFDALFFSTQVPAVFALDWVRRLPTLVATDISPIQYDAMAAQYGHRPDRPGLVRWLKHRVNTTVFRSAVRLLPWSGWAGQSLADDYGVERNRIEVLPVGVDLSLWGTIRQADRQARPPRLLFVGGDFARKGGRQLLEAFGRLGEGRAELHLVTREAVTPAPGLFVYRDLYPNDPTLRGLYAQADVFVLPSLSEAFGIAAVEASAVGLPAVVSDSGGLAEIVADGETGFVVPAGDVAALTAKLEVLLADRDLRRAMGRAARQRAEALFDMHKNGARVVEHLLGAVGKQSPYPTF